MSDLKINNITDRTGDSGPVIAGVSTVTSTGSFTVPVGPTEYRGGRGRGVFGSGATPTATNVIDMIEIATTGNAADFGDDNTAGRQEGCASFSSSTRGILAGGYAPPAASPGVISTISYFNFSSNGGMNDFGDLKNPMYSQGGCGNSTRGLSGGGMDEPSTSIPYSNIVEYVTLTSTGDGTDFGNLTVGRRYLASGIASPTRGIWHGGGAAPSGVSNIIDYVTITTLGNAKDFGDLITGRNAQTGTSNSTRGLIISGQTPTNLNIIEYVTIATEGNGTDFGDVSNAVDYAGACASSTRGVVAGGQTPTKINVIEYVTIASTGNASDFGDLTVARRFGQGSSDVHGGLG